MKNIPEIKLAVIAGSADWLPSDKAIRNQKNLTEKYKEKYGENNGRIG